MAGTSRKLEVFVMSGRTDIGPIDYESLFRTLARLPPQKRTRELGERLVAATSIRFIKRRALIRVIEGPLGMKPLIFDAKRASERTPN